MRLLAITLACCMLLRAQGTGTAPSDAAARSAFVETIVERDTVFVHEVVTFRFRVGVERRFLDENLIQTFQRRLDVPVRLEVDGLDRLAGTVAPKAAAEPTNGARQTLAFNGAIIEALREADTAIEGRAFVVLSVHHRIIPTEPGEISVPAPRLAFTSATAFRDDFVNGRTPIDQKESVVHGRAVTLRAQALPIDGRPRGFGGAVGQFTLDASAEPSSVRVGESVRLRVTIHGEGNLGFFAPPDPAGIAGFRALGRIDHDLAGRSMTFDLAPLSTSVHEIPPLTLPFFEPRAAAYRTAATSPIPISVLPGDGGASEVVRTVDPSSRAIPGESDIYDIKPEGPAATDGARLVTPVSVSVVFCAPWLAMLGATLVRRRRAALAADPVGAAARTAAVRFEETMADASADATLAFTVFLGAHLRCTPSAVVSPDLAARLREAGADAGLATETASFLDRAIAAGYGGRAVPDAAAQARRLVARLQPALSRREDSA